jgi:cytochrome bd-type quinol oxidase subunit 2
MRRLLFLSRLAFICGVFFLVSVSLLITDWVKNPTLESTIITIGWLMGMILLPITNLCYLVVLLIKKKLKEYVPLWLVVANLFFLLFLIYFIFYLNDPYYNQK